MPTGQVFWYDRYEGPRSLWKSAGAFKVRLYGHTATFDTGCSVANRLRALRRSGIPPLVMCFSDIISYKSQMIELSKVAVLLQITRIP